MFWHIIAILGLIFGFGIFDPLSTSITYNLNRLFPIRELTPEQLAHLRLLKVISPEEFKDRMKTLGFDEEKAEQFFKLYERYFTAEQYLAMKWRGIISEDEYYDALEKLGFDKDKAAKFEELHKYIPSVDDIIRFSVREVFSEQTVKKYGYDEEFDAIWQQMEKWANYIGLEKDVARLYWRAHWEVPSPTQAYEMLHRLHPDVLKVRGEAYREMGLDPEKLETTLDDVRTILKIHDYIPYWRDRLVAISYSPLTRVDLRRLYQLGIIQDDEEMIARLMEYGYTRKDAELLLEFFKKTKHEEKFSIALGHLERAYKEGMITESEFKEYLAQAGYSDDEIEFLVQYVNYEKEMEKKEWKVKAIYERARKGIITIEQAESEFRSIPLPEEEVKYLIAKLTEHKKSEQRPLSKYEIKESYLNNLINYDQAYSYLIQIGYSDENAKLLLDLWMTEKLEKKKHLTKSDIRKMFERGLLTESEAKNELLAIGYAERDADMLLELWKSEIKKREEKEALEEEKRRMLSKSDIRKMFKLGIISESEALAKLIELGYSSEDAQQLIELWKEELEAKR